MSGDYLGIFINQSKCYEFTGKDRFHLSTLSTAYAPLSAETALSPKKYVELDLPIAIAFNCSIFFSSSKASRARSFISVVGFSPESDVVMASAID